MLFLCAILAALVALTIQLVYNTHFLFLKWNEWRVHTYYTVKHPRNHHANRGAKWQKASLSEVGEVVTADHRIKQTARSSKTDGCSKKLRILTWNIELGYKLQELIAKMKSIQADIIFLQEVDIIDDGDGLSVSSVGEIARALNMTYVFCGNFRYEVNKGAGIFGNAILSKFDLYNASMVDIKEIIPRYPKGCLRANLMHPKWGQILCYSIHLEAVTGIGNRAKQMVRVLNDWHTHGKQNVTACIMAGDLNTLGHDMSRISPAHCRDSYRFSTLGQSEAEWFERNFFSAPDQLGYGFSDPFHKSDRKDHTLKNNLISAKFDWTLVNGLSVTSKEIGTYGTESDHWYVWIDVCLDKYTSPNNQARAPCIR